MKKYANDFIVGLFIVMGVFGLFYLFYSTGKLTLKKDGYFIYVVFNDITGLDKKAPVMLNGLEVGKVLDIKPSYEGDLTRMILKLWLAKDVMVRENPVISIKSSGLVGGKFVQISSCEGKQIIKPGSLIYGKTSLDLDSLMENVQTISGDLSRQMNALISALRSPVEQNRPSIDGIIKNLEATSKNFEEFSADVKKHPWKLLFKTKENKKN